MELTEKEKFAYECGYRDACLKHGIPFVKVECTEDKIIHVNVQLTNAYSFGCMLKDDFRKFVAEWIVKWIERELSKAEKDKANENKTAGRDKERGEQEI